MKTQRSTGMKGTLSRSLSILLPSDRSDDIVRKLTRPSRQTRSEEQDRWLQSARLSRVAGGIVTRSWGEGPRVLLVHNWGGCGAQLHHFIEPIVRRGFEVIAVDLPGHGDSKGRFVTPLRVKNALLELGRVLGPIHAVAANGYGAVCALWAASEGLVAKKIVLLAGWSQHIWQEVTGHLPIPQRTLQRVEKKLESAFKFPLSELAIERFGPAVSAPVLMLHGSDDRQFCTEHAERALTYLPKAELRALDGTDNLRLLSDPRAVSMVADFVAFDTRRTRPA